jgi:hypothetical protein
MKQGLSLILTLALVMVPCAVFAAPSSQIAITVTVTQSVSVSVTPDSYAFGATSENQTLATTADAFTAINDGNGSENLTITVGNSANWQAASAIAKDKFVMNYNIGSGWNLITPISGSSLINGLVKDGQQTFGLQLLVPSATDFGGVQQSIPVTVTAQAL